MHDLGHYHADPLCKKAKKSLEPFLRKTVLLTNYYRSDFMGPGDTVTGPKSSHPPSYPLNLGNLGILIPTAEVVGSS